MIIKRTKIYSIFGPKVKKVNKYIQTPDGDVFKYAGSIPDTPEARAKAEKEAKAFLEKKIQEDKRLKKYSIDQFKVYFK